MPGKRRGFMECDFEIIRLDHPYSESYLDLLLRSVDLAQPHLLRHESFNL